MLKISYKIIKEIQAKRCKNHLSVSRGRKVMGIMAMVVAQILLCFENILYKFVNGLPCLFLLMVIFLAIDKQSFMKLLPENKRGGSV